MTNYNDGKTYEAGLCRYDPSSGKFYATKDWGRQKKGSEVGRYDKDGYYLVSIKGVWKRAHRLAWELYYGEEPSGEIDHINGVRDDNRIDNLRLADHSENHENRGISSANKSGYVGVSKCTRSNVWRARVKKNGVEIRVGRFKTKEDAYAAYLKAKASAHKFNPTVREVPDE